MLLIVGNPGTGYNAALQQIILLKIKRGNKLFKVAHVVNAPTDADLLDYEKGRNIRYRQADKAELGENGLATNDESFAAAIALWNKLAVRVEGYKPTDDWRDKVRESDKVAAITENLLAVEVLEEAIVETETGELLDEDADQGSRVIEMRSLFAGEEVETSHEFRAPNAAELKKYRALMAVSYAVKGSRMRSSDIRVPSRAKDLAIFYDNLLIESRGYVGNLVPLHHKIVAAITHFDRELETLAGN